MGRIKGWMRWANYWIHTETIRNNSEIKTYVQVAQQPPMNRKKNWRVQIYSNLWTGVISRTGMYKKDAVKYAKNWMREHPKG